MFYQPSSENNMKLEWIEKLDSTLSIVKSTWNGNIITGDCNIDLFASTKIQKKYIEVLENYDLNNHISKATQIGKTLIDHIVSNIPINKILHSDVLPCPTISNVLWLTRHDVVVITTAQLHSTKHELRFCPGSNPACGMSEIRDGEDL